MSETAPALGVPLAEDQGAFRVVAPNPGPMTYHGTNSWFVETGAGLLLIDPGPDDASHLAALVAAGAGRITHIAVSHGHTDHVGLAGRIGRVLGLPVHVPAGMEVRPDCATIAIEDGDLVGPLIAIHTPGHAPEHLCFARGDGLLFTADHIMGWSTSVVPPAPWGSSADYARSLTLIRSRYDRRLLCGHGAPVDDPQRLIAALLVQRSRRERQIASLICEGEVTIDALMAVIYPGISPGLDGAARANVAGHLGKLVEDGIAVEASGVWRARGN